MNEMIKEFLFLEQLLASWDMNWPLSQGKIQTSDIQSTVDIHYRSHDIFIRFPH